MTCKDCGKDGFANPWEIRKHKEEKHGVALRVKGGRRKTAPSKGGGDAQPTRRKYTRRAKVEATPSDSPIVDAEASLLCIVINAFANAATDRDADFRVLEYVAQRFGPAAYEDEAPG